MDLRNKKIGIVMTGSFCTFSKVIEQIKVLVKMGADVIPIMSFNSYNLDTKFGKAEEIINEIEYITNKKILNTIQGVEPIGPKKMTDIMLVAPCSGNTLAKLANGITDTPAVMAVNAYQVWWQVRIIALGKVAKKDNLNSYLQKIFQVYS